MIDNLIEKVLSDVNCSTEVAWGWYLSTKNTLSNSYGYSSNQLVFGYDPNIPSVIDNKITGLAGRPSSKLLLSHLHALYSARRFIKIEADKKLRHEIC